MTALALTLARWTGSPLVLVDQEGHGREDLFPDVDVTRTVGWFTTIYPALLDLRGAEEPGPALRAVKEQMRNVPNHGIGYGLLRYLSDRPEAARLRDLPRSEVIFNYQGQVGGVPPAGEAAPAEEGGTEKRPAAFAYARESAGADLSPRAERTHLLEVEGGVYGGELRFSWTYSTHLHDRGTATALAAGFMESLRAIIAHCLTPEAGSFVPEDFPLAQLDEKQLGQLSSLLDEIDGFSE